ncbi:hypothetical protein AB9F26_09515 [Falsihalocynthiibacter sp. BN13B15]|uniref:hypothetical protein n=1 Tax=Falsihalocynthiibacter sp. BN13B15 TaxID=3240871 RepID=UPI0035102430
MSSLNTALTHATKLLILAQDVFLGFNEDQMVENELGEPLKVYQISFHDNSKGDYPAMRVTSQDETATAIHLDERKVLLSIDVELAGLLQLQAVLNEYRHNDLWKTCTEFVRGTLKVQIDYDDHDTLPLAPMNVSFEMDNVLSQQLCFSEEQLLKDFDLLGQWCTFLYSCFLKDGQSKRKVALIRQAAAFVLESFPDWDIKSIDKVLLLCSVAQSVDQLAIKFPDAFPAYGWP